MNIFYLYKSLLLSATLMVSAAVLPTWAASESPANAATAAADDSADDDKVVCQLPYSQSFDNENGDYEGTSFLPTGWLSVGTSPFFTLNEGSLPAKDGKWYALSLASSVARDDRMYTPFFRLEQGVTYEARFWLYMPGYNGAASNFDFTVGTEQDSEFHTSLLSLKAYTNKGWTEQTVRYTPTESGLYCFSFALGGEQTLAGECAVDLFTFKAEGQLDKPRAAFGYDAHFNLMDSRMVMLEGSGSVKMRNLTANADSFEWECDGAEPSTSTEREPVFTFTKEGDYTVRLTARNASGEGSTEKTLPVSFVNNATQLPLMTYNPDYDKLWTQDDMPSYSTAVGADWVTGVNHYYRKMAERVDVPAGYDYTIHSVTVYMCYYNICSRYYDQQLALPFRIVAYPEKDGRPDLQNAYGSYTTTLGEAFGKTGLGVAEMRGLMLKQPIVAKGPFFLALEFDDAMWIDEPESSVSRTVVGFGGVTHQSGSTSFYCKPTLLPADAAFTADGGYCAVDQVESRLAGTGLNAVLWMDIARDEAAAIATVGKPEAAVSAWFDGDRLMLGGTAGGSRVEVFDVSGRQVASAAVSDGVAELPVAVRPGVYVVKANGAAVKVMKR